MRGLLSDVNVQGHLPYIRLLLVKSDLWPILTDCDIDFVTLRDLGLPPSLDDRSLWDRCQRDQWVLFTENRNADGPDSLQATLADSWQRGHLPVLTLANKGRFEHSPGYALRVAKDLAELLFGIRSREYCDQPRIYVPR